MKVTTYEATVENGQVKILGPATLPERARVFVVAPDVESAPPLLHARSPRFVNREGARDFVKEVFEEGPDDGP